MSVVRHSHFPRSMFDLDLWNRPFEFGPSALDMFDPFDELDMQMGNSLNWLSKPFFRGPLYVPQKYRVTVDVSGFKPESIKTEIKNDKLVISAHEGNNRSNGDKEDDDYSIKEFKKSYKLPHNLETDQLTSFVTRGGHLVVEIPLKEESESDFMPQIVDTDDGHKAVNMKMALPHEINPSEITVTAKDHDIIVKGQHCDKSDNSFSEFKYYRRSTMPENADLSHLKCTLDDNKLLLNAPIVAKNAKLTDKNVPIAIESSKSG